MTLPRAGSSGMRHVSSATHQYDNTEINPKANRV
jgi:hypothetical protein